MREVLLFPNIHSAFLILHDLHPNSEHLADRFRITIRLTVLQQTKALQEERAEAGTSPSKQVENIKHFNQRR